MLETPEQIEKLMLRAIAPALAILLVVSGVPARAAAEIPHENFQLANSDLTMVIAMLNSSIRASEGALGEMYEENLVQADEYLDSVGRVLTPTGRLLGDIKNVAGSYNNLTELIPPFEGLYAGEGSFSSMEGTLLEIRDDVVSFSQLENLTDEDLSRALEEIRTVYSLIANMNSTIDDMLVHATAITVLTVDQHQPFADNNLTARIERLRELLHFVIADINQVIHDRVNWGDARPFVLLWVADTSLHLGEELIGGGYVFLNGSFAASADVTIKIDSTNLANSTTGPYGSFTFSYEIPVSLSWLGDHVLVATTRTPYENLTSNPVTISISRVPTVLTISSASTLLAYDQNATVTIKLADYKGIPLPGSQINLTHDSEIAGVSTDSKGTNRSNWEAPDLGFGTHSFSASYVGRLPYASNDSGEIQITVNIPTSIYLKLFTQKLAENYKIVGNGTLLANRTTPIPGQLITLYVDGIEAESSVTEDDGSFAFSIPSTDLSRGGHQLTAAFEHRDIMWRYSDASVAFTIIEPTRGKYPFFPGIPGWNTGPATTFPYLFFGENAYYTWLFVLLAIGIAIRTMQARKTRAERKGLAIEAGTIHDIEPDLEKSGGITIDDLALESGSRPKGSYDPNEIVVQYYVRLIGFLRKKRKVSIPDSMTHRELSSFLQSLGYQETYVRRVTELFEKAMYSGGRVSEDEAVRMTTDVSHIVGYSRGGAAGAS